MKAELQNKLAEKYPVFFEYLKEHRKMIMPMQFGIECGDGWYFLIDNLMSTIQNHIDGINSQTQFKSKFWRWFFRFSGIVDKNICRFKWSRKLYIRFRSKMNEKLERELVPQISVDVMQIKEKFSGLRFYINGGDDAIYGMISLAENMSYGICESCSSTIEVGTTTGWLRTLCKTCATKENVIDRWNVHL